MIRQPCTFSGSLGGRGWLGRVGAGCDYQIASRFVIGTFGDYDFMNLHGTFEDLAGDEKESGAWAVGGRVGYLVTPSLLTYFDGGYTQTRFDQVNSIPVGNVPPGIYIAAQTYNGWFIGSGTEYALYGIVPFHGLFWRNEYRYSSYQAADLPFLSTGTGLPAPGGAGEHMQKQVQTITTGLVWRFNFGGPIATRY